MGAYPGTGVAGVLTAYFALIAVVTAVIFAVDVALYEHWGFRIDATVLIYLSDPEEAMASVDFWLGVRQTLLAAAYAALMLWAYCRILRIFDGRSRRLAAGPARKSRRRRARGIRLPGDPRRAGGPRWPMFRRSISAPCRF